MMMTDNEILWRYDGGDAWTTANVNGYTVGINGPTASSCGLGDMTLAPPVYIVGYYDVDGDWHSNSSHAHIDIAFHEAEKLWADLNGEA